MSNSLKHTKRLQSADIENPDLEEKMLIEDEYLKALIERDNTITFFKEQLDLEKKLSQEKDKVLEEKDKVLEEKNKGLISSAKKLKEMGMSANDISSITGLSIETVEKL